MEVRLRADSLDCDDRLKAAAGALTVLLQVTGDPGGYREGEKKRAGRRQVSRRRGIILSLLKIPLRP